MGEQAQEIIEDFKDQLNMDGRENVFNRNRRLKPEHLKKESKPESLTLDDLIRPVLEENGVVSITSERKFTGIRGDVRWADNEIKTEDGRKMILEAKSVNTDLEKDSERGAVKQIKGLFRLVEVRDQYEYGIATDGIRWIIIDKETRKVYDLELPEDYDQLARVLQGEVEVSAGKIEEEISKKFYDWYDALLHGGTYRDHEDNKKSISEEDCLVEQIKTVEDRKQRERLAQTLMDRLIFIRFLQSKDIIDFDLLSYLSELNEDILNSKLKQLFFHVLNTPEHQRNNLDSKFEDIPYLNGSLFIRTEIEKEHLNYVVGAEILREVINFLDSFKFVHDEGLSDHQALDPEILGYIFERAMTGAERKDTGAYYTPRTVTSYIAEETIHAEILDQANDKLREMDYKESELLEDIEELYRLRETTLSDIFSDLIHNFRVCDNACGSGAFLLAGGEVLLEVYNTITEEIRLGHSEIALRKLILKNNLYGVDINPNAVEIAKLRLWLWVVDAYDADSIEPLPNIDYNLRAGNSLLGYSDISKFKQEKIRDIGHYSSEKALQNLLEKRKEKVSEYKDKSGVQTRQLKEEIDEMDRKIEKLLNVNFFREVRKASDLTKEEVQELDPFHWGYEFQEVFEEGGFDVIIGNPPYVRQEGLADIKEFLKARYDVYHGRADLYTYFFQRSMETLHEDGYMAYIVSNKWLRTGYGQKLREYLNQYRVEQFIDFGDLEVFKGVAAYPCIAMIKKSDTGNESILSVQVDTEEYAPLDAYVQENSYISSQEALEDQAWSFPRVEVMEMMDKLEGRTNTLEKYLETNDMDYHYGVKTGRKEAFVIDEETRNELIEKDESSKEVIKPFLTGRYIRRYFLRDSGKYVIFTRRGIDIDKYPAIKEHLSQWKEDLTPKESRGDSGPGRKPGSYEWYEIQDTIDYWKEFEKPKIIYGKFATAPRFALDDGSYYFNDASFMIRPADKHLLGILNSTMGWFLITQICTKIQSGYQLIWKYFSNFPVPEGHSDELEELVGELSELKENEDADEDRIEELDQRIDEIVYDLYGLTDQEIEIIEQEVDL